MLSLHPSVNQCDNAVTFPNISGFFLSQFCRRCAHFVDRATANARQFDDRAREFSGPTAGGHEEQDVDPDAARGGAALAELVVLEPVTRVKLDGRLLLFFSLRHARTLLRPISKNARAREPPRTRAAPRTHLTIFPVDQSSCPAAAAWYVRTRSRWPADVTRFTA